LSDNIYFILYKILVGACGAHLIGGPAIMLALRSRSAIFLCKALIFASCLATCSLSLAAFALNFAALASFLAEI